MEKYKMLAASIVFLALSVLFGSLWIGNSLSGGNAGGNPPEKSMDYSDKALLTMDEAAIFLGLPAEEIEQIIKTEQAYMDKYHTFTGKMFPYVKLHNKFYFNREELTEWVREKADHRTDFDLYPTF
jgi:hypothetical protein